MPTGADFDRAVRNIGDCIDDIGDDVQNTIPAENDPTRTVGYEATHGSWTYAVKGDPQQNGLFFIAFPFSIIGNLTQILDDEAARSVLDDESGSGEQFHQRAALEILGGIHDHQMNQFRHHLIDEISTTDAAHNLGVENGAVVGFEVTRSIYPLDDGFTLTEFSHSVQTVISSGINGVRFVNRAFDFESLIENTGADPDQLPYIQ